MGPILYYARNFGINITIFTDPYIKKILISHLINKINFGLRPLS